jgi:hypothetical protein
MEEKLLYDGNGNLITISIVPVHIHVAPKTVNGS